MSRGRWRPGLQSFDSKVLGTGGRVMVGEVLDRVLSESKGPILVTPEPHPASKVRTSKRIKTEGSEEPAVLVAADGSEVSVRNGEYAVRLAGGLGAKSFAFYLLDEHLAFHGGIHYGKFVERLSLDGREAMGEVRAMAEEAGAECEELIIYGRLDRSIFTAIEELEADPIFFGDEGMSGLEHALMGSVCEEALRHANTTALVIDGHPDGEGPEEGS